jgi:hypothetical protein
VSDLLLTRFDFDPSFPADFVSVPLLAFKCAWTACARRDLVYQQFPEKFKPAYEEILRERCRGGFSFSCRDRLSAGEPLRPAAADGGPAAACVLELDINSSYGFAASNARAPGGFCSGFVRDDGGLLLRGDVTQRHRSFEFRSVFFTLWLLESRHRFVPAGVFSNFHAPGLFLVGPHPVDLAVANRGGQLLLFNFDGQFCHGCPAGCPPLRRYANGEDPSELLRRTRARDLRIKAWADAVNGRAGDRVVSYFVVSDCHGRGYSRLELEEAFRETPELRRLLEPYRQVALAEEGVLLAAAAGGDFGEALRDLPPEVTFLAVADCRDGDGNSDREEEEEEEHGACLFAFGEDPATGAKWRKRARASPPEGGLLLSRDLADYLHETRPGFRVTGLRAAFFFPRWRRLNETFAALVEARAAASGSLEKRLLKNFVNFACGYFGLNPGKGAVAGAKSRPTVRLTPRLSQAVDLSRVSVASATSFGGNEFFVLKSYPRARGQGTAASARKKRRKDEEEEEGDGSGERKKPRVAKACVSPLPLFACVVEFGKLRLQQVLDWLEGCSEPGTLRHLYTNVDNLILALASDSLDGLPRPGDAETFRKGWLEFFGPPTRAGADREVSDGDAAAAVQPGGLKLVWRLGPEDRWTFTSFALQNWSVVAQSGAGSFGRDGRFKSNLLKDVTAQEYHRIACRLLGGEEARVPQTRARDRAVGTETVRFDVKLKPPCPTSLPPPSV